MYTLYPEIEPFRTGRLRVSDVHEIFYEEVGREGGKPVVFLHGGPGVGIMPIYRRFFDPSAYHVILPDQRGAGQSTPHAELRDNTTWHLVDDLERLRRHLGIDKWQVFGGSWGSMLALCYAIRHPESISGIILRGVCIGTQAETDWLFKRGTSEIYPDEWERFQATIPPAERGDMVKAYYARLTDPDEKVRLAAASAWSRWEGATMSMVPDLDDIEKFTADHMALSIARIECTYTLNGFFLESDNYILDNAQRFSHIPGRMVQGRFDVICPVRAAWELHKRWPASHLNIAQRGAHSPTDEEMVHLLVESTEMFKSL